MKRPIEPRSKTEGGKTFKSLDDSGEKLYYLVYDSNKNMVTESGEDNPLPEGNVVDSEHESFGSATYKEMVEQARKLGIKR